jgi:hypothetical protein
MILLGERATFTTIADGLLVLAGIVVVQKAPEMPHSQPPENP